jgi:hypothetical protein
MVRLLLSAPSKCRPVPPVGRALPRSFFPSFFPACFPSLRRVHTLLQRTFQLCFKFRGVRARASPARPALPVPPPSLRGVTVRCAVRALARAYARTARAFHGVQAQAQTSPACVFFSSFLFSGARSSPRPLAHVCVRVRCVHACARMAVRRPARAYTCTPAPVPVLHGDPCCIRVQMCALSPAPRSQTPATQAGRPMVALSLCQHVHSSSLTLTHQRDHCTALARAHPPPPIRAPSLPAARHSEHTKKNTHVYWTPLTGPPLWLDLRPPARGAARLQYTGNPGSTSL